MTVPPTAPEPGPAGSADEPRASAVLIGIVAVLLGAVAIVAIVSGGGGGAAGGSHLDAEERAIERAAAARAGALPGEGHVGVARRATDAGVARSPEAGIASPSLAAPAERPPAPSIPAVATRPALVPGERPPGVSGEITEAQEYEATAFFLDLLILRRDTLRRDLETARRVGDGPRIRRLEPDEATLDAEIARFVERSRELEARTRERAAEDEPPSDEPDPTESDLPEPTVAPR